MEKVNSKIKIVSKQVMDNIDSLTYMDRTAKLNMTIRDMFNKIESKDEYRDLKEYLDLNNARYTEEYLIAHVFKNVERFRKVNDEPYYIVKGDVTLGEECSLCFDGESGFLIMKYGDPIDSAYQFKTIEDAEKYHTPHTKVIEVHEHIDEKGRLMYSSTKVE